MLDLGHGAVLWLKNIRRKNQAIKTERQKKAIMIVRSAVNFK